MLLLMGKLHYSILLIAIGLVVYACIVLYLFQFFSTKKRRIIFAIVAGLVLLASTIPTIQYTYESKITMNANEESIFEYQPFTDSAKIARLETESTLTLKSDLPKMDGATALYPLYSAFVEATYPKKEYYPYESEVMVNTTPDAYSNLIFGKVDMIFAAAPSKAQQVTAKQYGKELHLTPIGREAFVFFVHRKNEVDNLTMNQIKSIYSGKFTNWKEAGGDNDQIRAFQRPEGSGSQSALQSIMGDVPIMEAPTEDVVTGMGGIINEVSQYKNYKNAIGYTFRFYSTEMVKDKKIKLLEIEGVKPSKENIRTGAYPFTSEFYIVTTESDNPNIQKFIDWILSSQGQQLLEKAGYVPLN